MTSEESFKRLVDLTFELCQSVLDDQHGIKESSFREIEKLKDEISPNLSILERLKWNDMLKKVKSTEDRFYLPEE